ncbi:MAG: RDD family protein [Nonlabens sp.]
MSNTAINTAQNVNISYKVASLGHRMLAFLLDGLILISYLTVLELVDVGVSELTPSDFDLGISQLFLLPVLLYSLLFHLIFNGRTCGKFIMKIKVVKLDGAPATWSDYLTRWIIRLIDIWASSGAVGIIAIIFTDENQRLGDAAANTIVIDNRKKTKVSHTILEEVHEGYNPSFTMVHQLTDQQVNEIKEIYRLAGESRDYQTLNLLRNKIEQLLNIKSEMKDAIFVRTVLKDYTYLTQGS